MPVDLVCSLAKFVLTDTAQCIVAKFLLPGWCVGKGDQIITRPLVQLGQRRSRLSAVDIPPDLPEYPLHTGLVVNFAVDMPVFAHTEPPLIARHLFQLRLAALCFAHAYQLQHSEQRRSFAVDE